MKELINLIDGFTGNMSEIEGLALMDLALRSTGDILEIGL